MKRFGAILAGFLAIATVAVVIAQLAGEHGATKSHARVVHHYFVIAASCTSRSGHGHAPDCWTATHPTMLSSALVARNKR